MEPEPTPQKDALPWFIVLDAGQPRIRWAVLSLRFGLFAALQVLVCLSITWWSHGRVSAAQIGIVVLPMAAVAGFVIYRAYGRALPGGSVLARGQLSLLAAFAVVSTLCLWLALVRFDHQRELSWQAQRQQLENELNRIVGTGRVHWSGNQATLLVKVDRPDFGDADLQQLLARVQTQVSPRGGIYLLDLSGTAVTDDGVAMLNRCSQLRFLFLDKTAVTDVGLQSVAELPQLQVLSARAAAVTQKCLDQIRSRRPGLSLEPRRVDSQK